MEPVPDPIPKPRAGAEIHDAYGVTAAPETTAPHEWVVAATVHVDPSQAKQAAIHGRLRITKDLRVDALETYCDGCRLPFAKAAEDPCAVHLPQLHPDKAHLVGGDQTRRVRRVGPDAGRRVSTNAAEDTRYERAADRQAAALRRLRTREANQGNTRPDGRGHGRSEYGDGRKPGHPWRADGYSYRQFAKRAEAAKAKAAEEQEAGE